MFSALPQEANTAITRFCLLYILADLDGQGLLDACWLEHQSSVNTATTVGQVMKGCHMCTEHNWPFLVPRLLSNYLSVCGIHIIASSFWPSMNYGYLEVA